MSISINPKASIYAGIGFSSLLFKDAQSLQASPAPSPPGYETTIENGGSVNHFNGQSSASSILILGQARFGTKINITKKIAFVIDTRAIYRGKGDFTFGSTLMFSL